MSLSIWKRFKVCVTNATLRPTQPSDGKSAYMLSLMISLKISMGILTLGAETLCCKFWNTGKTLIVQSKYLVHFVVLQPISS